MMNPFLPIEVCIPDGEPHVFEDRVYLYGSHDRLNGDKFCMEDYQVYSASVDDLSCWSTKGVSYRRDQDIRSKKGKLIQMYAPDCVKGNDGKYYLYYFACGNNTTPFGPMSVAVSENPDGPFMYLSDIKRKDGTPLLTYLTNDPAVINDDGKIYLYYGWGLGRDFRNKLLKPLYNFVLSKLCHRSYKEIKETKPSVLSCACVPLEDDMYTIKEEPHAVLDSITTADKKSELYKHPFYEAASIRKFDDIYYLIYSSGKNNELAYATSCYPDRDFKYEGVLISNSDLGYNGNKKMKMASGTIHGSVEKIKDKYYVFYHRCTNNTDFSRQACLEEIKMKDHKFIQAEMTTSSAGGSLPTKGKYSAAYCCNLYNSKTKNVQGNNKKNKQPNIAFDGKDFIARAITDGTTVGYKYFDFNSNDHLNIKVRGCASDVIIKIEDGTVLGHISTSNDAKWTSYSIPLIKVNGVHPLYLEFKGRGLRDLLEIEF